MKFEILIQRKVFPYQKGNEIQRFDLGTFREETEDVVKLTEMNVDMKRQIVYLDFDTPVELCGDIKLTIQCTGAITDQTTFIWFHTDFVSRQNTLFIEPEIDYSGRSFFFRRRNTSQNNILESQPDPPSHSDVLSSESNIRNPTYGSLGSTRSLLSLSQSEPVDKSMEYILLSFDDCHLSTEPDPDASIIRQENRLISPSTFESKNGLRTIGETRKKVKGIVSGGTQILMATTEMVGKSLASLVNGETYLGDIRERRVSSSSSSIVSSSVISNSKKSQSVVDSSKFLEQSTEESEESVVYEVIRNEDESDSSS